MRRHLLIFVIAASLLGCATTMRAGAARASSSIAGRLCAIRVMQGQVYEVAFAACAAAPDVPPACTIGLAVHPGVHLAPACWPRPHTDAEPPAERTRPVAVAGDAEPRLASNPYVTVPSNPYVTVPSNPYANRPAPNPYLAH